MRALLLIIIFSALILAAVALLVRTGIEYERKTREDEIKIEGIK